MLHSRRIFVSLTCGFVVALLLIGTFPYKHATASACPFGQESVAENYFSSDLVFKGLVEHVDEQSRQATFKVLQWYKFLGMKEPKQRRVDIHGSFVRSNLEVNYPGRELIVYATLKSIETRSIQAFGKPCSSASKLTIGDQIKIYKHATSDNSKSIQKSTHNLIAVGQLLKAVHEIGGPQGVEAPRSFLTFNVIDVLRGDISTLPTSRQITFATTCGQGYLVPNSYLLYAHQRVRRDSVTKDKQWSYDLDCTQIFLTTEETVLKGLASKEGD